MAAGTRRLAVSALRQAASARDALLVEGAQKAVSTQLGGGSSSGGSGACSCGGSSASGASESRSVAWPHDRRRLLAGGPTALTRAAPSLFFPAAARLYSSNASSSASTSTTSSSTSTTSSAGGPRALYDEGVKSGAYRPDPLQAATVGKLQALYDELRLAYPAPRRPSGLTIVDSVAVKQDKRSWLQGLSTLLQSSSGLAPQPGLSRAAAKGLYMYGGVGCGKTMLMDLFVRAAPREFQVTRTHFHDFMLDVHARLRTTARGEADPLVRVADEIAVTSKVLALDELFVTDVADAAMLHRLFGRLWDQGLVLVATSNRAPDRLYEGGLQRALFVPFIERLKQQCVVHDMASPVDYRRLARHARGLYFVAPDRDEALYEAFVEAAAATTTGGGAGSGTSGSAGAGVGATTPAPADVPVAMGRVLHVPDALGRAAMFDFDELCEAAVAAADYIALAHAYHTVALSGVPAFGPHNRTAAYRFVTLIDVLYENRVKLLVSAAAMPFELFERVYTQEAWRAREAAAHYPSPQQQRQQQHLQATAAAVRGAHNSSGEAGGGGGGGGTAASAEPLVDNELGFAKDRTISRLTEMQSLEYLVAHAEAHEPSLALALREALAAQRRAGAAA